MSLTSNEIIMIAAPWMTALVAGLTAVGVTAQIRKRRATRQGTVTIGADTGAMGDVWVQLTADESATVRKMLERDFQDDGGRPRPSAISRASGRPFPRRR